MKKIFLVFLVLLLALAVMGCDDSATINGKEVECVGLGEDKLPEYTYRVDKSNVFVGILFLETIIVPVVVVADQLWCPVAEKPVG